MTLFRDSGQALLILDDFHVSRRTDDFHVSRRTDDFRASKVHRIEGNQDLTLKGVGALNAQCLEHKRIQESNKALPSTSSLPALEPAPVTPSSRTLSLPPPSPRESQSPSTPNGARQSNGPLQHTHSMPGLKDINESSSSRETFSNGTHSGEAMGNTTTSSGLFSIFSMPRIALPSTSSLPALEPAPVTPSSRTLSLPPPSPRESQSPSTPNGARQSNGPLQHTHSMPGLKDINESSSSRETFSNGTHSGEAMGNTTTSSGLFSIFSMPRIVRTRSAVDAVPANSTGPQ
ncbi:hypothetical protein F2Q70_00021090 [Brassica cretica]|uniref:Uncharacterized protein n=1 Tax=Brassica cretica TaxID=69181 RepID=A0A8S9H025_BRACR|nr:hypothetical protein F2Q70_00021090 [Brassica cretica]